MKIKEDFRRFYTETEATLERKNEPARAVLDKAFFERTEQYRNTFYPYFNELMQFDGYGGKRILEVGVGQGVDQKQFVDNGANTFGLDMTPRHARITKERLQSSGFPSQIVVADAEKLIFPNNTFDLVYSCGVLFYAPNIEHAIKEIHRVLKPGGEVVALFYNRKSFMRLFQIFVFQGLVRGQLRFLNRDTLGHWYAGDGYGFPPFKFFSRSELRWLFRDFQVECIDGTELRSPDLPGVGRYLLPRWLLKVYEPYWGYYLTIRARKAMD